MSEATKQTEEIFNELADDFYTGMGLNDQTMQEFFKVHLNRLNVPLATQVADILNNPEYSIKIKLATAWVFGRIIERNILYSNMQKVFGING